MWKRQMEKKSIKVGWRRKASRLGGEGKCEGWVEKGSVKVGWRREGAHCPLSWVVFDNQLTTKFG